MELSSVFGGDTLKASDLQGNEPTVKIARVEMKKFDNGNKLVINFVGKKKALVCNKTNANRIAHSLGTNTDNWIGQEIVLFTDLVDFQGNTVEAIRVRVPKKTAPQRQEANGDDGGFDENAPHMRPATRADMDDEIPF
jgi:hypothetical protein